MSASRSFLQVNQVSAAYDNKPVVNDVSFSLAEGELACLLGPSGCGKTTILRAISGFQSLNAGSISLGENLLCDTSGGVVPEKRNVGMVFQDHALFPHLNIYDNISFGLKSLIRAEQQQRVTDLLKLIGMPEYADKYPHELSGGQSQRIALARAIAPQPKLLLLDEPFSNLDTELRESLGYEVRGLLKELNMTAIMVTHDQHDAFALGDSVGVMSEGKLMQWDTSFNLYHTPQNRFVASFIGDGIFIEGQMTEKNTVKTALGEIRGESANQQFLAQDVDLLLRPDDVKLEANKADTLHSPIMHGRALHGRIIKKAFKGAQTLYTIEHESGNKLLSLMPSHENYKIGDNIGLVIGADHLVCFSR